MLTFCQKVNNAIPYIIEEFFNAHLLILKYKWILRPIRASSLFMLEQKATRVISELYPEIGMTERTCERWFAKFREGDRSL